MTEVQVATTRPELEQRLGAELSRLRAAHLYRTRRVIDGNHGVILHVDGRALINFCSNDYLGLASDPRIAEAARRASTHCGWGSGAAALISGYNREHAALEESLADFLGRPRALLFTSGWAANLGVLRALFGKHDTLLCDDLNHASLIDGARLSGAQYRRIAHGDTAAYAEELAVAEGAGTGALGIVTDSVFSMDGDLADLSGLAALAEQHHATLIVDDAHGFGVLGSDGRGACEHLLGRGAAAPAVYIATLGKSLGAAGAFVAGSDVLIEYLIQRARTWVFSTAPPPATAAAARAALEIIRTEPEHRQRLLGNIAHFRRGAAALNLPLLPSMTAIQPLVLGDAASALAASRRLYDRGYWVAAIRPPTVPTGTSRLRITLSAAHTLDQIDGLLAALAAA
jgi:8-amino-7-oxononanoate synthase